MGTKIRIYILSSIAPGFASVGNQWRRNKACKKNSNPDMAFAEKPCAKISSERFLVVNS